MSAARPSSRDASVRRRSSIVDAARELVRERGFEKVLVSDVAERADVSVGTVYNLVGPRDQLFLAVLEETVAEIDHRVAIASAASGVDRCVQVGVTACELLVEDAGLHRPVLGSLYQFTGGDAPIPGLGELFRTCVVDGIGQGDLCDNIPPEVVAAHVHYAFRGVLWTWVEGQIGDVELTPSAELAMLFVLMASSTQVVRPTVAMRIGELGEQLRDSGIRHAG